MNFVIKSFFILTASIAIGLPLTAQADSSRNQAIAERFAKCDANQDGKLTLDEAKGCMPRIYSNFSYIDSGNKGYVTVAEIQAMASK
ncbi:hypothetical protein [Polynucleobacter necessarius]|uniref:hypothetical protein n=1 Tax=Polynucleobacter necessarius TaxID=576610 RepID=UPI000E098011|nr:hypothetical protein [Polynucleobacter necessarius]